MNMTLHHQSTHYPTTTQELKSRSGDLRIIETKFIEVETSPGNSIIVAVVYRPNTHPTLTSTAQLEQFLVSFENILMELDRLNKTCYLLTDSNIDLLKVDTHARTKQFLDSMYDYKFLQIITKVTRCVNGSVSLIDHIITNSNNYL